MKKLLTVCSMVVFTGACGSLSVGVLCRPKTTTPRFINASEQKNVSQSDDADLLAAAENGNREIVNALLAQGVNVNAANNFGNTALMVAADKSRPEIAKVLIAAGADVNTANKYGYTALMFAADKGSLEITAALIEAGANVNLRSAVGYTALFMVLRNTCDTAQTCEDALKLVRVLIESGANVNAETKEGETALILASNLNNIDAVKVLLAYGADVNKTNVLGETALCIARKGGNTDVFELLKSTGAVGCRNKTSEQLIGRITPTQDSASKYGVYVPKDISDSFRELRKMLHPNLIKKFKSGTEDDLIDYHFSLGLWMRNNWGLWDDSHLDQYFNRMGVTEADDMSMIILKSFWRRLNDQPVKLQEQVRFYQDMAKKRTLIAN